MLLKVLVTHWRLCNYLSRKNLKEHLKNTLLDGEMVIDVHEGKPIPRYLIYDIIRFKGELPVRVLIDYKFHLLQLME